MLIHMKDWWVAPTLLEVGLDFRRVRCDPRPGQPGIAQGQHADEEDTGADAQEKAAHDAESEAELGRIDLRPGASWEQSQRTKLGASLPTAAPTIPPAAPAASVQDITATIA